MYPSCRIRGERGEIEIYRKREKDGE